MLDASLSVFAFCMMFFVDKYKFDSLRVQFGSPRRKIGSLRRKIGSPRV